MMPPHDVYIESHLGGGAVLRNKTPAKLNIGIDLNASVIEAWKSPSFSGIELVHGRAEDFLASYRFTGDEIVYCDPPYYPTTRSRSKVYAHDYSECDHERLLELLLTLPCRVMLSGYSNSLYEATLKTWNRRTFNAKTHSGVREESLWFNFDSPAQLHDCRYIGNDFRERQSTKRRMERMQLKVAAMHPVERAALIAWLHKTYPTNQELA